MITMLREPNMSSPSIYESDTASDERYVRVYQVEFQSNSIPDRPRSPLAPKSKQPFKSLTLPRNPHSDCPPNSSYRSNSSPTTTVQSPSWKYGSRHSASQN